MNDYAKRKQEEARQRFELIKESLEQGKPISIADKRFYDFYRVCMIGKEGRN